MQDFQFFERDEIVEFIKSIEMAEATGAMSVQNPAGGSMTFRSFLDIARTKRRLYRRLEIIDGKNYGATTHATIITPVMHPPNLAHGRRRGPWGA